MRLRNARSLACGRGADGRQLTLLAALNGSPRKQAQIGDGVVVTRTFPAIKARLPSRVLNHLNCYAIGVLAGPRCSARRRAQWLAPFVLRVPFSLGGSVTL